MPKNYYHSGFTLIEMSIVLLIIGLLVGGILVGQDMIQSAAVRSQIAQIQKYDAAVNAFTNKYGFLPGDIRDPYATQFGFKPRGTLPGQGDGDQLIAGSHVANLDTFGWIEGVGETAMFWVDLSTAGLIAGGFSTASPSVLGGSDITGAGIDLYLPRAKLGYGNYVYVWSTQNSNNLYANLYPGNYFGISAITSIADASAAGKVYSSLAISAAQAYAIDKKMDDGFPLSGLVQTVGLNNDPYWSVNTTIWPQTSSHQYDILYNTTTPDSTALPGASNTCIDNGNNASNPTVYSTEYNGGKNQNCALSFLMQGAAR